ncbi:MAG: LLM class flavin-dependent oxidoreductase, partial [Alphaproteobacteria bacterium]
LKVLRLLWEKENVSFEGEFYSFPELTMFPRPIQRPGPPLIVAGDVPVAVDRAARLGDMWMCGPVVDLGYAKALSSIYREKCEAINRKPDWILRRYGWIKPTRKEVEDNALQQYVDGVLVHWRESSKDKDFREVLHRLDQGEKISAAEIAHNRLVWGSPEDAIAQISGFRADLGAEHIHISFGAGLHSVGKKNSQFGEASELANMFRLFGREVISAFK